MYDVNVQHWELGQRRDEQLLKITSFLLWTWPFGFSFYKVPKWNQMIQGELDVASSPEMLVFWFIENIEKPWLKEQWTTTQ